MAKRGTLEHPKTKRLARALGLPGWAALGLLESVWHWVGRYCPNGEMTDEDLLDCQDTIRFDGDLCAILSESGWLDPLGEFGRWYIHDWHDHADDTVKKTLQKRQEQFANGASVRKQNDSRITPEQEPEPIANDSRHATATALSHEPKPQPEPTEVWAMFEKVPAFANGLKSAQIEGLTKVCAEFAHLGRDKLLAAAADCAGWYSVKPKWGGKDTTHSDSAPNQFRSWLKRVKPDENLNGTAKPPRKRPPAIEREAS